MSPSTTIATGELLAGLGSDGVNVTLVQRALIVLGYDLGSADGDWGNNTQQAWDQFERSSQAPVVVDGVFTSIEASVVGGYASLYVEPVKPAPPPVSIAPVEPEPAVPVVPPMTQSCSKARQDEIATSIAMRTDGATVRETDKYANATLTFATLCDNSWPFVASETLSWAQLLGLADDTMQCLSYFKLVDCMSEFEAFMAHV